MEVTIAVRRSDGSMEVTISIGRSDGSVSQLKIPIAIRRSDGSVSQLKIPVAIRGSNRSMRTGYSIYTPAHKQGENKYCQNFNTLHITPAFFRQTLVRCSVRS